MMLRRRATLCISLPDLMMSTSLSPVHHDDPSLVVTVSALAGRKAQAQWHVPRAPAAQNLKVMACNSWCVGRATNAPPRKRNHESPGREDLATDGPAPSSVSQPEVRRSFIATTVWVPGHTTRAPRVCLTAVSKHRNRRVRCGGRRYKRWHAPLVCEGVLLYAQGRRCHAHARTGVRSAF